MWASNGCRVESRPFAIIFHSRRRRCAKNSRLRIFLLTVIRNWIRRGTHPENGPTKACNYKQRGSSLQSEISQWSRRDGFRCAGRRERPACHSLNVNSEVGQRCRRLLAWGGHSCLPVGRLSSRPRPDWKVRRTGRLEGLPHIVG